MHSTTLPIAISPAFYFILFFLFGDPLTCMEKNLLSFPEYLYSRNVILDECFPDNLPNKIKVLIYNIFIFFTQDTRFWKKFSVLLKKKNFSYYRFILLFFSACVCVCFGTRKTFKFLSVWTAVIFFKLLHCNYYYNVI